MPEIVDYMRSQVDEVDIETKEAKVQRRLNRTKCLKDENATLHGKLYSDVVESLDTIGIGFFHCWQDKNQENCASHEEAKIFWRS